MAAEAGKGDSVRPTNHQAYGSNYDNIFRKKMTTFTKFGAGWCGPCSAMDKTILQIKEVYPNLVVTNVDVDQDQQLSRESGIRSVPTMIRYEDGVEIARITGVQSQEKLITWMGLN